MSLAPTSVEIWQAYAEELEMRERRSKLYSLVSILLTLLLTSPSSSSTISTLGRALEYKEVFDYYAGFGGLYSSYQTCRARGATESRCRSTFTYCAINPIPLSGLAGAFFSAYQLNQLFMVDCGNGTCFQCCFVPSNPAGCHTSFIGFPVINCNASYGPGTRNAGLTLVTDPDPKPGQACLFTPQTCDHIPLCLRNQAPATIDAINSNPNHILHDEAAASRRGRTVGTELLGAWSKFLSDHHTSLPVDQSLASAPRSRLIPVSSVAAFVSTRGCTGWRENLSAQYPFDWSNPQFRIDDENGEFAAEVSHLNGVLQLGMVRLVASIPNFHERLGVVESRIRPLNEISDYLGQIENPDRSLLEHISPVGLEVLKKVTTFQDYRLFGVPLAGEDTDPALYNGCQLGAAPDVDLEYQNVGSLSINLAVAPTSLEPGSLGGVILWGDGVETRIEIPEGSPPIEVGHQYQRGGKYQVLVVLEAVSGLRAAGGVVIQTQTTAIDTSVHHVPILSEIQLLDLRARLSAYAGDSSMFFQMEGWSTPEQGHPFGISAAKPVPLGPAVSFGHLIGWNMAAKPLDRVTLRTAWYNLLFPLGTRNSHLTMGGLRLGVYSTEKHRIEYVDVPIHFQNIRLYESGSAVPISIQTPQFDEEGRLKIPIVADGRHYDRVDLIFPNSALTQALMSPVVDPSWTGVDGSFREGSPDSLLEQMLFNDGFEGGDTSSWSFSAPNQP